MNVEEKYGWIVKELLSGTSLWTEDDYGFMSISLVSHANGRIYLLEGSRGNEEGVEMEIHDAIMKGYHPYDITFSKIHAYNPHSTYPYTECNALTAASIYAN